jgi:hypothetical protein
VSGVRVCQLHRDRDVDRARWMDLWEKSLGVTLFHNPSFLAYHGPRFDEHHLGFFKGDTLFAMMPMAMVEAGGETKAASPYGGSYGGIISPAAMTYSTAKAVVAALIEYLRDLQVAEIVVTPPVRPYYPSGYSQTLLFAMLEQGFVSTNSDITSVIPLTPPIHEVVLTSRARRNARKAEKAGITCSQRAKEEDFWPLMELTFGRHGTTPAHSFGEWEWLTRTLPDHVWVDVAYCGRKAVAGIGHFKISESTDSSFYLCSDSAYKETQALTLLICRALSSARAAGHSWFDLGTSSKNMVANENIFRFKEGFGSVGVLRQSFSATL